MANRTQGLFCGLLPAVLILLPGCSELGIGPTPPMLGAGCAPVRATAAKPGWSTAPNGKPILMEILPVEATSPVQTPQILIATVHEQDGTPCRKSRVEWKLEGVGEIVAVEESGSSPNQGERIDGKNAVSYTESTERRVSRNGDAATAFLVKPGQSWCVITSSAPGESYVIAKVADSSNRSVIVRHWVEDDRAFPHASTRPSDRGINLVQYQGSAIFLTPKAPAAVLSGQAIPCTLTVNNTGTTDAHGLMVRMTVPDGLLYVESKPAAVVEGKELVWTIDELPARHSQTLQVLYKSSGLGTFTHRAALTSGDGAADEKTFLTEVTNAQLKVGVTEPTTATVGVPASYEITVLNLGSAPATHVLLSDALDPGLEHATKSNPIELPLGVLAPGEKRTATLVLTPRRTGPLTQHLTVTADGNLSDRAESTLSVQQGKVEVQVLGPNLRYVGRPAVWEIQVSNPGSVLVSNVAVSASVPAELTVLSASEGGVVSGEDRGGEVRWRLGTLGSREQKVVQVTTRCDQLAERSLVRAFVTADAGMQAGAEAALAVHGLPAFRVQVVDLTDPIQVGERTTYRIDVANEGTLAGHQVQITAEAPPQLRLISARGPSQPRIEGQKIVFPPVESLAPHQTLTYQVEVEALQPNDALFHVELHSPDLTDPITVQESTTIYAPGAAPRTAPRAPTKTSPPADGGQRDSFQAVPPANGGARPPPDWSTPADNTTSPSPSGKTTNWRLRR